METIFEKAEKLAGTFKEYLHTSIELAKLKASEKIARIMANVIAAIVVAMIFLFCVCFGAIALALGLGKLTGETWLGFLLVAVLLLLTGIVIWKARRRLIFLPVLNALIGEFFKQPHEKD